MPTALLLLYIGPETPETPETPAAHPVAIRRQPNSPMMRLAIATLDLSLGLVKAWLTLSWLLMITRGTAKMLASIPFPRVVVGSEGARA